MHYLAFDNKWFQKHQSALLYLCNSVLTRRWFRWVLRIRKGDLAYRGPIAYLAPNHYTIISNRELKSEFRAHPKYAKRLYHSFKPLWWALHFWDWLVADRLIPEWSYGLATLTVYPESGNPASNVCDGDIGCLDSTYSTAHDAATGTNLDGAGTVNSILVRNGLISTTYHVFRALTFFDTSALTSSATISAAVLSLYANDKDDSANADSVSIVTSSIVSNTAYALADFDLFGTTKQASDILISGITLSAYNDWTLNGTGIGNISLTGVTKFGLRTAQDISNTTPTLRNDAYFNSADTGGTTTDPKLVITYTVPGGNTGAFFQFF